MTGNAYLDQAAAAAETLTTRWFTEEAISNWVPDDYWRTPNIAAELVTYMTLAGNQTYLGVCQAAQQAGHWDLTDSLFLDDACAWGHFHVAAACWLEGQQDVRAPFAQDAQTVYQNLRQQWTDQCGGGLFWMRDPGATGNFKASNSTLEVAEIAMRIGSPGEPAAADLAFAEQCWDWTVAKQLLDARGTVWGGLDPSSCQILQDNTPVLQIQGDALGPLWRMHQATGTESYLDAAARIVQGTFDLFVWPGTHILSNGAVDGEWSSGDETFHKKHSNETLFKGIFIDFLGELTEYLATVDGQAQRASQYADLIRANADAVAANYPTGVYGMDWHTADPAYEGDPDALISACLQFSGLAAFNAAARVAAVPPAG